MENVYIAKLAVVTSDPKRVMIHWSFSFSVAALTRKLASEALPSEPFPNSTFATQGVVLSDQNTPLSRANCSSVTGRKEPICCYKTILLDEKPHK